ncbi:MAG: UDP-3-O-acyl-N-acetylglucosamine deacetylase [Candidatus Tyrphobacter sp.]
MNESTLRDAVHFAGVGLHTGAECAVELRPAPAGAGIAFVRGGVRIPATAEYVVDTARATVLGRDGTTVSTVEHLLSALAGTNVANVEILVDGPEVPIVDGSAHAFCESIVAVGLSEQDAPRHCFAPATPLEIRERDCALVLLPSDELRIRFVADFAPPIGVQYFDGVITPEFYRSDIAPARTFGYLHEVESLRARGLARGGTLENAIVFAPTGAMQELRWPDEVVRHKVLDLLGDLALLGVRPQCDIIAIKSGHELHAAATLSLRRAGAGAAQREASASGSR